MFGERDIGVFWGLQKMTEGNRIKTVPAEKLKTWFLKYVYGIKLIK